MKTKASLDFEPKKNIHQSEPEVHARVQIIYLSTYLLIHLFTYLVMYIFTDFINSAS